ncbi:hypothetical protein TrLO_g7104 [Triparma laevis f. longispina]|uniref:NLE domain-containing protein n=1 Tax=Triparma laevis f. longispina TaxID=1714387 RepID=A0A9W7DYJ1_9STRA|nr:hypothetical protein TrLO_g7104 [Triparma laevis f. longispina]
MSGLTWGGSMVGKTNPDAKLGYAGSKRGRDGEDLKSEDDLPSSVVIQLSAAKSGDDDTDTTNADDDENAFPPIDVPIDTNTTQLEALVNNLLNGDDEDEKKKTQTTPYAFYLSRVSPSGEAVEDIEIATSLMDAIKRANVLAAQSSSGASPISTEAVIKITYQPLAVFRVRPVTRCTDTMPGHTDAVLFVSFSGNGKNLASGGGDTTVRFWDVNTCLPKHTCPGHRNHILCLAWSPDTTKLASADKNGVVIIWDPTTGKMIGSPIKAHSKWITSIAWEPMHRNKLCERLVTSSKDNLVKIWNVRTQRVIATMSGHSDSVECCKWGGEGLIYTGSRDRTIKVWGAEGPNNGDVGKLVKTLTGHGHRVNALALSCDYVCRTGPFDHTGTAPADVDAAFAKAKERYEEVKSQGPERLVSGSDDFTLFYWHPRESKKPIKRLTGHQQAVCSISFSPDARHFASASFDKKIKVWDGRNGNFVATLTGHVGAVYQVAWSSDSRYLVTASKDSTAKLWQVSDYKKAKETLPGHADEVYALDWSPNGSAVATGSKDRTIKIWKH